MSHHEFNLIEVQIKHAFGLRLEIKNVTRVFLKATRMLLLHLCLRKCVFHVEQISNAYSNML